MFLNFLPQNCNTSGAVVLNGSALEGMSFDANMLRPFVENGKRYVSRHTGEYITNDNGIQVPKLEAISVGEFIQNGVRHPVFNNTLALRKDEWLQLDTVVIKAARKRLRAYADIAAANSVGGFDAMAKSVFEYETMSDPLEAKQDMDGLSATRHDEAINTLQGTPLPITHAGFRFSSRKMAIGRGVGQPLELSHAEAAGRRVGELVEKITIGTVTGMTYGRTADYGRAPKVYGYTNYPDRATKTDLTAPTASNGTTIVDDVLAMRELAYDSNFFGDFMLYTSTNYDRYLDNDLKANSDITVRQRLLEIDNISGVRRLDYLSGIFILLVQITSDVVRSINGMCITTVQWETDGGMAMNFKVMAIQVPQIRSDSLGQCGVVHGTTS